MEHLIRHKNNSSARFQYSIKQLPFLKNWFETNTPNEV